MDIVGRKLAALEKAVAELQRAARLSSASLDDSALLVRDDAGSLRGIVGQQGDGTTAVTIVNGPPPPQPSAPLVMSVLGGVAASWDGQFTDGVLPLDWSRTEVHAAPDSGFTPSAGTLQSTIETAQGATVVIPTDDPVYVRLMARTTSGTASMPSLEVGPLGPTPVVAAGLLDGIVTTVKLANDAVTTAKVAAGAIGSTQISDGAVTTPKIVAGAVQTAQLDAEAVNASKIAAGAVTTAKLDALAVTADKIAANSITTAKLAAGAVDATALKADAITGKTITGGAINGTTITGSTVQTATTGKRLAMTPDGHLLAYSGRAGGETPGEIVTGINSDGEMELGYLVIKPPTHGPTPPELTMSIGPGGERQWYAGPLTLLSEGSGSSMNLTGSLTVTGGVVLQSTLSVGSTPFTTYTPTVTGGGSATFTTRTGWYYKIGKMVYFCAHFTVNAAGSGTTNVTITAPSTIFRGTRQVLPVHGRGVYLFGLAANGHAYTYETGTGAVIDQITLSNDNANNRDGVLQGANLVADAQVTVQGWYREA